MEDKDFQQGGIRTLWEAIYDYVTYDYVTYDYDDEENETDI